MSSAASHDHGGPHVNRRQYWVIFVWLIIFTLLEVGIVEVDISRFSMISGLIGMAVAKAGLVAYYYMHLNHETSYMRRVVLLFLCIPVVYAILLVGEGVWRAWSPGMAGVY